MGFEAFGGDRGGYDCKPERMCLCACERGGTGPGALLRCWFQRRGRLGSMTARRPGALRKAAYCLISRETVMRVGILGIRLGNMFAPETCGCESCDGA